MVLNDAVRPRGRPVAGPLVAMLIAGLLLLCACDAQPALPRSATPIGTPAPNAQPSPTPQATSDPRVAWPPDPKAFVPASAVIVDSSEVDTDGDGVGEMLVIYQDQDSGRGLVIRREGAGGLAYPLGGDSKPELFRDHWVSNTVRDVNQDGKVEIVVRGVVHGQAETVHVFQWNGSAYATLLALNGTEGVAMDDPQNDGVLDFTALQMLFQRSAIIHTVHAEWAGKSYRQSDDVLFLLGSAIDFSHPEETVLAYYQAWSDGNTTQMLALLSEPQKTRTPATALAEFARVTSAVHVETLSIDSEEAASAIVSASIRTVDRATHAEQLSKQTWRLTLEDKQWRLAERLDTTP